ncbi:MAG: glycosyltransferase family 39 protein [Candidatus Alcyoniella australis]|nr:glycosyltransferase family 39 protein [Candidatus Alcyoniella australis]
MNSRRIAEPFYALGLIVGALLLRLAIIAVSDNAVSSEQEAYSRLNLMLQWQRNPGIYPQLEFAPLHTYWLAACYYGLGRSVWAVRLATAALSGVGLWALWDVMRRLCRGRTALLALALAAIAYIPAAVSTVSLAEGPALALFCLALSCFVRASAARRTPDWGWLVACALLLNLAGGFRFEAWAFVPLLALALWRTPRAALALAAMGAVFPLIHIGVCWYKLGDPLHSLLLPSQVAQIQELGKPAAQRLLGWPLALRAALGWGVLLPALIGVVVCLRERRMRLLPWLVLPLLALLELRAYGGSMAPDLLRYSTMVGVLICCIAACAFDPLLSGRKALRLIGTIVAAVVLLAAGIHTVCGLNEQRIETGLGSGPRQAARLLRTQAGEHDMLLTSQSFHGYLAVESGLRIEQIRFPECTSVPHSAPWAQQRDCLADDLARKLVGLDVTYLALDSSDEVVRALIAANGNAIIPADSLLVLHNLVEQGAFALYRVDRRGE